MITGIDHFALISSSEASVEFYERLGFKERFRKQREKDTIVLMSGYGIDLEMFIDPSHPKHAKNPENIGLRHLALKVDNIEETVNSLGLKTGRVMNDWCDVRFVFIEDPDGLTVELHE